MTVCVGCGLDVGVDGRLEVDLAGPCNGLVCRDDGLFVPGDGGPRAESGLTAAGLMYDFGPQSGDFDDLRTSPPVCTAFTNANECRAALVSFTFAAQYNLRADAGQVGFHLEDSAAFGGPYLAEADFAFSSGVPWLLVDNWFTMLPGVLVPPGETATRCWNLYSVGVGVTNGEGQMQIDLGHHAVWV